MKLNPRLPSLAAAVGLLASSPISAAAIHDQTQWQRLTPSEKALYLAGYADRQGQALEGAGDEYVALMTGETRCVRELFPKPFDLALIVDTAYAHDPASAGDNPGLVFSRQLAAVCRAYINQERARLRLAPMP